METEGLKGANQGMCQFLWADRVLRLRKNINHQVHFLDFDPSQRPLPRIRRRLRSSGEASHRSAFAR